MKLQKQHRKDCGKYYCMRQWSRFSNVSSIWIVIGASWLNEILHAQSTCNNLKWINFHNMSYIFISMPAYTYNNSSNADTDDKDVASSEEKLKFLKQLTKIVCCNINEAMSHQTNCKKWQNRRKPLSLDIRCDERYNPSQSAQDVSILNASQYTTVWLQGTSVFFNAIIGQECQKLRIDDNMLTLIYPNLISQEYKNYHFNEIQHQ